ncbi:2-amino-5-chloromuconate deaminase CnbZ [Fodinicurvata halophila]|uniref:2-amino-5-chloromuconate deaminase CnbZ n=1 Tax=Fodinicurvata halophila TaxID=1419723 RepID=UPI0036330799
MTEISRMSEGGYAYVPGVFQYSAGVAALSGFRIERVRFSEVVPLQEGFSRVAKHLESLGRPLAAFCACELRSPGQFSEEGFRTFNAAYGDVLRKWGIIRDEINPVARANVCPEGMGPDEPGFHAFCYTVPSEQEDHSFVIAGSGEAPEGKGNYRDHIIRRGDTSPEGCAKRQDGCSTRWNAVWLSSEQAGRRPRVCSFIRSMTFTSWCQRRSSVAGPPDMA